MQLKSRKSRQRPFQVLAQVHWSFLSNKSTIYSDQIVIYINFCLKRLLREIRVKLKFFWRRLCSSWTQITGLLFASCSDKVFGFDNYSRLEWEVHARITVCWFFAYCSLRWNEWKSSCHIKSRIKGKLMLHLYVFCRLKTTTPLYYAAEAL